MVCKLVILVLNLCAPPIFGQESADKGEQREFVIANFKTESGVILPEARIVYGTFGHLNAAGNNAVLLPSH